MRSLKKKNIYITLLPSFQNFSQKEPDDSSLGPKHVAYVKIHSSSYVDSSTSDPQAALVCYTVEFIM